MTTTTCRTCGPLTLTDYAADKHAREHGHVLVTGPDDLPRAERCGACGGTGVVAVER